MPSLSSPAPFSLRMEARSGRSYTAGVASNGALVCTCPAFAYSPRSAKDCKHLRALDRLLPATGALPATLRLDV